MARKATTKQIEKQQDLIIEQIYRKNCSGMEINIMRIPALFTMARKMLVADASYDEVGAAMVAFVNGAASVKGAV